MEHGSWEKIKFGSVLLRLMLFCFPEERIASLEFHVCLHHSHFPSQFLRKFILIRSGMNVSVSLPYCLLLLFIFHVVAFSIFFFA